MDIMVLAFLLTAGSQGRVSVSRAAAVDPNAVAKTSAQIASQLTPSARLKLQNVASSLMTQPNLSEMAFIQIRAAFPGATLGTNDVEALQFVVMSEAVKSANDDLKSIATEVSRMNDQKEAIRRRLEEVGEGVPASGSQLSKVQVAPGSTWTRAPTSLPASASIQELKQRFSQLNEMISMNQGLEQTMTRNVKQANTILSGSLKKVQAVQSPVIPTLK